MTATQTKIRPQAAAKKGRKPKPLKAATTAQSVEIIDVKNLRVSTLN